MADYILFAVVASPRRRWRALPAISGQAAESPRVPRRSRPPRALASASRKRSHGVDELRPLRHAPRLGRAREPLRDPYRLRHALRGGRLLDPRPTGEVEQPPVLLLYALVRGPRDGPHLVLHRPAYAVRRLGAHEPPTYALAGFRKGSEESNEAAIKYAILGALSSAVILYAISLTYGLTGRRGSPPP